MQAVTPNLVQSQPNHTPHTVFSKETHEPKRLKFRIVANSLHKTSVVGHKFHTRSRYKSIENKANSCFNSMIYRPVGSIKRRSGIDLTADNQKYGYQKHQYSSDSEEEGGCDMTQKQYIKMSKKLDEKKKLKIGTRNFNKSFYSKLANKIVEKPVSFFKFGLKETEKSSCKAVFTELFNIEPQKLRGTLSTTELWDNKISMKYLKQNEMFFNKDILIKQFESIDKEHKQRKRALQIEKEKQFVSKYREMVRENQKINKKNMNYQEVRDMDAREACVYIRKEIDKLMDLGYKNYRKQSSQGSSLLKTIKRGNTNSRKIIAGLEKYYDQFDQIANKFNNKMVVLL